MYIYPLLLTSNLQTVQGSTFEQCEQMILMLVKHTWEGFWLDVTDWTFAFYSTSPQVQLK